MKPNRSDSNVRALLLAGVASCTLCLASAISTPFDVPFPPQMTLKTAVLTNTVPLAFYDEKYQGEEGELFPAYRGFQPDLMRQIVKIAKDFDDVTLTWELEQAPAFSYTAQFEFMANDCIGKLDENLIPNTEEECNRLDLVIGDYYGYPSRSIRTLFTPPLLTTAASSVQYVNRKQRQVTTLLEAEALQEPVCLLDESHYDTQALERFPKLKALRCYSHEDCIAFLKEEKCALFVEDELQLRYLMVQDADLLVTPEKFDEQYIVWPMNARADALTQQLVIRWIYEAKVSGFLDKLYDKYFRIHFCPLGKAGVNCDQPCSTAHGVSDRYGTCICESTKWTGADCNTEVVENMNLLPMSLRVLCYMMIAINFFVVVVCGIWLFFFREASPVKVAQPLFLGLVLLGCLTSTSTIFALVQEDDGSNGHGEANVPACMAVPWLYSVGFCITFGSLLSKILRVYRLFKAAATMQRVTVTTKDTLSIIGGVLLVDVLLLTIWTVVDPLQWNRHALTEDKFGNPLSSEGYCVSDNWAVFAGLIAAYHLLLMGVACFMCYAARDIPTEFSEGKYVTIAMVSNLQIFVVAVPVLIILGADSQTSIFVRSVIIWMNDFVVVTLIFGNLFRIVHLENRLQDNSKQLIREAMNTYKERQERRESSMLEARPMSSFASINSLNDSNHSSRYSVKSGRSSFLAGSTKSPRPSLFGRSSHRHPAPTTSTTNTSSVPDQSSDVLANSNRSAASQRRLALAVDGGDISEGDQNDQPVKRHSDPYMETLMEVSTRSEVDASNRSASGHFNAPSTRSMRASIRNADGEQAEKLDVIADETLHSSVGDLTTASESTMNSRSGKEFDELSGTDLSLGGIGAKTCGEHESSEGDEGDKICGDIQEAVAPPSITS